MDPNQAWLDLSKAIVDDNWGLAAEIASNLLEWLAKGGFPPTISGQASFDAIVARSTCENIASWDCI
jgi:hypothetical protein